ncbi:MAG: diadenylate cyclase [Methanolinea sp.]|nr:diadenylate cyclase [Methanolinea sp.]
MHKGDFFVSAARQIFTTVVIVLFLVCGAVSAEAPENRTPGLSDNSSGPAPGNVSPTTFETTVSATLEIPPVPPSPPPRLVLEKIEVNNLTCTVYGTASPGSGNDTITTIRWDWGDNSSPEYHGFPYTHRYQDDGTYTLAVTATQSDGKDTTELAVLVIERSVIPGAPPFMENLTPGPQGGPGIPLSPPVLTLLEPVIDGLNVTLNGNLNTGSPGATISSVSVDWGDGIFLQYADLPATYRYPKAGIFTINVTGSQSDGLSSSKRITLDLKEETSGPPGQTTGSPPPASQQVYLYILITAILVAAIAGFAQWFLRRKPDPASNPDIPGSISVQEEIFYDAKRRGDLTTAAASAHICAQMLRSLAEESPGKRATYLKMAEEWEKNSVEAGRSAFREHLAEGAKILPGNLPDAGEQEKICEGTDVTPEVLNSVLQVALQIAREGREGQAVGTSFVVGDTGQVLAHSKQFVLNPFHGHKEGERRITDTAFAGNIKEFAQLDGAFLITGDGVVEAAGRYITVDMSKVHIPKGLGSRHSSVAGITMATRSIGVVVSQSGGMITLFRDGKIVYSLRA